jgi:hypothetical protein
VSDVTPFAALFDSTGGNLNPTADPTAEFEDAEMIPARDAMSEEDYVVFGRDVLEEVAGTGREQYLRILRIGLDVGTEELDQVLDLVVEVKGRHDYREGYLSPD